MIQPLTKRDKLQKILDDVEPGWLIVEQWGGIDRNPFDKNTSTDTLLILTSEA